MNALKQAFERFDGLLDRVTRLATSLCLLIIILVVLYAVLLRYVFDAPPFWSDRIGVFANVAMILCGLSLTVRNRNSSPCKRCMRRFPRNLRLCWMAPGTC
jgi:TRAP-type C4-dicarboxylate transport system permease small subunit